MTRKTIYKEVKVEVEVDVEMDDFDDADLIDELESRGYEISEKNQSLLNIELDEYQYRRLVSILEDQGIHEGPEYRIYEEIKKIAYG